MQKKNAVLSSKLVRREDAEKFWGIYQKEAT